MTADEPWTVGRLLEWTTDYFRRRGSENPRLDAEVLLAKARGCERIELYTSFGELPDDDVRSVFREFVRRRAAGEPVAYVVGNREFYSLSFRVTSDVLIPRPETEFVVIALLDLAKQRSMNQQPLEIVDVGTGSGVLAICSAKHIPGCRVTAIDISPGALAIARGNADQHHVADQISFVEGDLLSNLPPEPQFDFVVSNPPYVAEHEMAELPREVSDFEPHSALLGGPRGVELIERLVAESASRLRAGGALITEISPMIEQDVHGLIHANEAFEPPTTVKDLAGHARVVTARLRSA